MRYKYPRTQHLPWSPGATNDDIRQGNTKHFEGKKVVITEKMDGENTSIYNDYIHARAIDGRFHQSRGWVRALQGSIGYLIPKGWRICGENLYAKHSIYYESLPSYFLAFSVWDDTNMCLSWEQTKSFTAQLGLHTPKVLYAGVWNERVIRALSFDTQTQEGYVVRITDGFHYSDFAQCTAKWVRPHHVTTDKHWMSTEIIPNGLKHKEEY